MGGGWCFSWQCNYHCGGLRVRLGTQKPLRKKEVLLGCRSEALKQQSTSSKFHTMNSSNYFFFYTSLLLLFDYTFINFFRFQLKLLMDLLCHKNFLINGHICLFLDLENWMRQNENYSRNYSINIFNNHALLKKKFYNLFFIYSRITVLKNKFKIYSDKNYKIMYFFLTNKTQQYQPRESTYRGDSNQGGLQIGRQGTNQGARFRTQKNKRPNKFGF